MVKWLACLALWCTWLSGEALPGYGFGADRFPAIEQVVTETIAGHDGWCGSFSLSRDGVLLMSRRYGFLDRARTKPVTDGVVMRLASVSKPLTAAMVHDLVERRKLKLDDKPYESWIKRGMLRNVPASYAAITVDMLLRHTAGWDLGATYDPAFYLPDQMLAGRQLKDLTPRELVRLFSTTPLQSVPGATHCYSNFGFIVLARVIEEAEGKPFNEAVRAFMKRELALDTFDVAGYPSERRLVQPSYNCDPNLNLAMMDGCCGILASTDGLCTFLDRFLISGHRFTGGVWTFTFYGSIPGTTSCIRQRLDGYRYAFVTNSRHEAPDVVPRIDALLDQLTVIPPAQR